MGRDVPFKREAVCDQCGRTGAYDFMGDYACQECSDKAIKTDGELDGDDYADRAEWSNRL